MSLKDFETSVRGYVAAVSPIEGAPTQLSRARHTLMEWVATEWLRVKRDVGDAEKRIGELTTLLDEIKNAKDLAAIKTLLVKAQAAGAPELATAYDLAITTGKLIETAQGCFEGVARDAGDAFKTGIATGKQALLHELDALTKDPKELLKTIAGVKDLPTEADLAVWGTKVEDELRGEFANLLDKHGISVDKLTDKDLGAYAAAKLKNCFEVGSSGLPAWLSNGNIVGGDVAGAVSTFEKAKKVYDAWGAIGGAEGGVGKANAIAAALELTGALGNSPELKRAAGLVSQGTQLYQMGVVMAASGGFAAGLICLQMVGGLGSMAGGMGAGGGDGGGTGAILKAIDGLKVYLQREFANLNTKLDRIETTLANLEALVKDLQRKVAGVERQLERLVADVRALSVQLAATAQMIYEIQAQSQQAKTLAHLKSRPMWISPELIRDFGDREHEARWASSPAATGGLGIDSLEVAYAQLEGYCAISAEARGTAQVPWAALELAIRKFNEETHASDSEGSATNLVALQSVWDCLRQTVEDFLPGEPDVRAPRMQLERDHAAWRDSAVGAVKEVLNQATTASGFASNLGPPDDLDSDVKRSFFARVVVQLESDCSSIEQAYKAFEFEVLIGMLTHLLEPMRTFTERNDFAETWGAGVALMPTFKVTEKYLPPGWDPNADAPSHQMSIAHPLWLKGDGPALFFHDVAALKAPEETVLNQTTLQPEQWVVQPGLKPHSFAIAVVNGPDPHQDAFEFVMSFDGDLVLTFPSPNELRKDKAFTPVRQVDAVYDGLTMEPRGKTYEWIKSEYMQAGNIRAERLWFLLHSGRYHFDRTSSPSTHFLIDEALARVGKDVLSALSKLAETGSLENLKTEVDKGGGDEPAVLIRNLIYAVLCYLQTKIGVLAVSHQLCFSLASMPGLRKNDRLIAKRELLLKHLERFDRHCTLIRAGSVTTMRGSMESCDPLSALIRPRIGSPREDIPTFKEGILHVWPNYFHQPVLIDRGALEPRGWSVVQRRLLAQSILTSGFPTLVKVGKGYFVDCMKVVWGDAAMRGGASRLAIMREQALKALQSMTGWDLKLSKTGGSERDALTLRVMRSSVDASMSFVAFNALWEPVGSGWCSFAEDNKLSSKPSKAGEAFSFTLTKVAADALDQWCLSGGATPTDSGTVGRGADTFDVTWTLTQSLSREALDLVDRDKKLAKALLSTDGKKRGGARRGKRAPSKRALTRA